VDGSGGAGSGATADDGASTDGSASAGGSGRPPGVPPSRRARIRQLAAGLGPDVALLRRSDEFRRLYAGQLWSYAGNSISFVGMPYQAYQLAHSSLVVGLLSFAELVPLVATALLGGALADAVDRRRLIRGSQLFLCGSGAALALNAAAWHQLWLLFLLGYNLSIASAIGFLALAGVSAEFGIVMLIYLDHAIAKRRAANQFNTEGDLIEAIEAGAVLRVRPKAMTVTVIIAGLLPIMFGGGTGSEVMRRIAAPMVGGMITAPILSMLVLPAAYLLLHRRELRRLAAK